MSVFVYTVNILHDLRMPRLSVSTNQCTNQCVVCSMLRGGVCDCVSCGSCPVGGCTVLLLLFLLQQLLLLLLFELFKVFSRESWEKVSNTQINTGILANPTKSKMSHLCESEREIVRVRVMRE